MASTRSCRSLPRSFRQKTPGEKPADDGDEGHREGWAGPSPSTSPQPQPNHPDTLSHPRPHPIRAQVHQVKLAKITSLKIAGSACWPSKRLLISAVLPSAASAL